MATASTWSKLDSIQLLSPSQIWWVHASCYHSTIITNTSQVLTIYCFPCTIFNIEVSMNQYSLYTCTCFCILCWDWYRYVSCGVNVTWLKVKNCYTDHATRTFSHSDVSALFSKANHNWVSELYGTPFTRKKYNILTVIVIDYDPNWLSFHSYQSTCAVDCLNSNRDVKFFSSFRYKIVGYFYWHTQLTYEWIKYYSLSHCEVCWTC